MQRQNLRYQFPNVTPVSFYHVFYHYANYIFQTEIREISQRSAPDVDSWIATAKSLQDDIEISRRLAGDIVQQATAEETREETIRDKGIHQEFLTKETAFTDTLLEALRLLQTVNNCLDKAERLIEERRILDAIKMLDGKNTPAELCWNVWLTYVDASKSLADAPSEKNTRAIRLLDQRVLELKSVAHEHLKGLWNHLVVVDAHKKELVINHTLPCKCDFLKQCSRLMSTAEPETLEDAISGLKYFEELDSAALALWQALDKIVIAPRTDLFLTLLPNITISKVF